MTTVEYSIGEDVPLCSTRKTKSLYLYRQKGSVVCTIARFYSPSQAEQFAKDWGFPLSDEVKAIIEKYKQEQGK